jgi:hypothetical protein
VSGSGSNALVFRAEVGDNQLDLNGIAVGTGIDANGGTLRDGAGNAAVVTLNGVADTSLVRVDSTPPTAVITREGAEITTGNTLSYLVEFSETVVNLDADQFTLATTGSLAGSITGIEHLGDNRYRVTIGNLSGEGSLGLQLAAGNRLADAAGNPLAGSNTAGAYTRLAQGGDPEFRIGQGTPPPRPLAPAPSA